MELIVETTDPEPHPGFTGPALDLLPLFTFGDAVPEDDEDRREL